MRLRRSAGKNAGRGRAGLGTYPFLAYLAVAFLLDIIVDLGVCLGGSLGHDQYPALELVPGARRPPATNFLCSLPQTAR